MIIRGRQIFHSKDTARLFFLCPYVEVETTSDGTILRRDDHEEGILLDFLPEKQLIQLFLNLREGFSEEQLIVAMEVAMSRESAKEWIEFLIQRGFVE